MTATIFVDADPPPRQYLAWGGEDDPMVALITAGDIAKDLSQAHYSGWHMWDHFAFVAHEGGALTITPVVIEGDGREIDEADYITQECLLVTGSVAAGTWTVIERFSYRIDGRA